MIETMTPLPGMMEEEKEKIEMRKRVDGIKDNNDQRPQDSPICDLADKENDYRKLLKSEELFIQIAERAKKDEESKKDEEKARILVNKLGDIHSTVVLEKMEAKEQAWMDELTQLKNRRALKEEGAQILSLESNQGKNCSLLILDIDFFKKINDTYGHPVGDKILEDFSKIIEDNIRTADIAYRYGGEEFVVLLPDANLAEVREIAERIREKVEAHAYILTDGTAIKHTVSIGCSDVSQIKNPKKRMSKEEATEALEELIINADKALYEAKENKRNQVVMFSPEE